MHIIINKCNCILLNRKSDFSYEKCYKQKTNVTKRAHLCKSPTQKYPQNHVIPNYRVIR